MPGTTRDAIDTVVETDDGPIRFVDTAGMRRKSRIDEGTEYYSFVRALQAVDASDVALLVIDATEGITHQDQRLAERIDAAGCPVVVLLNKWELLDAEANAPTSTYQVGQRLAFLGDSAGAQDQRPHRQGRARAVARAWPTRSRPTTGACRPGRSTRSSGGPGGAARAARRSGPVRHPGRHRPADVHPVRQQDAARAPTCATSSEAPRGVRSRAPRRSSCGCASARTDSTGGLACEPEGATAAARRYPQVGCCFAMDKPILAARRGRLLCRSGRVGPFGPQSAQRYRRGSSGVGATSDVTVARPLGVPQGAAHHRAVRRAGDRRRGHGGGRLRARPRRCSRFVLDPGGRCRIVFGPGLRTRGPAGRGAGSRARAAGRGGARPGGAGAAALGRAAGARGPARHRRLRGRPGLPGRHRPDGRRLLRRVPRRAEPASPPSSATSPATASSRRSPPSRPSTCCGCSCASTAIRPRRSRSSTRRCRRSSGGEEFISLCVVVFDTEAGTLRYASAGHPPAWLWHDREVRPLRATGPLLMLDPDGDVHQPGDPARHRRPRACSTPTGWPRPATASSCSARSASPTRSGAIPGVDPDVLCKSLLEAARDFASAPHHRRRRHPRHPHGR